MKTDGVFVRLIPLPATVHGCVRPNDDGTFSVYINSNDSESVRRDTLRHELRHIDLGHFWSDKTIAEMEREAEGDEAPLDRLREIVIYDSLEDLRENFI